MLLTTCPNCQAQFKVSTEQLNVRSGRVMCGRCRHVFNSFESLQRIDSTLGEPFPPAPAPVSAASGSFREDQEAPLLDERVADEPEAPVEEVPPGPVSVPAFLDSSQPPRPPESNTLSPYRNAPLPQQVMDAPVSSAGWTVLTVLAVLALLLQCVYLWRSELVSRYPELRPHLAKACEVLSCTLPWGRDVTVLKVEQSDLIEELGARNRFLLAATVANRGNATQDFPHLELSLTDTNNQTLVRRVLAPADYLGRSLAQGEGMGPGTTAQINVRMESQAANAAGYHLELFFP